MNVSEMMHTPSVAIIIVNWNSHSYTRACLLSLRQATYGNFQTIVVDNGSQDGSADLLEKEFPELILLRNEKNEGFTGGNNRGIQKALEMKVDYLMLLNNDTEVERDFLDNLVACIEKDAQIGAVQPKFFFLNNKDRIWNAGGKIMSSIGLVKTIGENKPTHQKYDLPQETEWITGCGFLVRAALIREIGGLNNRFFAYYEDVDWSLRIKSLGYKLAYCPKAVVYHEAGVSSKQKEKGKEGYLNPFVHYLSTRNNILLLRKYTPWYFAGSVLVFQGAKLGGIVGYLLLRGRFQKVRHVLKGLKDGLWSKGL